MKSPRRTNLFKRDFKRVLKRGYDESKFWLVVKLLCCDVLLEIKYRDHALHGKWSEYRECHIAPNWLLIYQVTDDELVLARTGTHADLFDE